MKHLESGHQAMCYKISSDGYPEVIRIKTAGLIRALVSYFTKVFFFLPEWPEACSNKKKNLKAQYNNRCGFHCLHRQRPLTSLLFPVRSQFGWNRFHPSCLTETIMLWQRIQAIAAASWEATWQSFGCRQLSLHPAKSSWSRANVTGGRWWFCPRHPPKTMVQGARPLIILSFRSVPMWQRGQRWTAKTRASS